ncbi:MAG TPA: hypothetical protein VEX67_01770 [Solirubrobacteraceae bacterium]|nr:hypothetical protein [Solirubrobacteraceae bacterium]
MLALQRTVGNRATCRILGRDAKDAKPKPAGGGAARFKVVIVDDGATGLSDKTMKTALDVVRAEIRRVTTQSTDATVKAGVTVELTKTAPGRMRELGRSTFLVFLTASTDAEYAVGLAAPHVDLDAEERKVQETRFARNVATEGGVHIDRIDGRGRSYGASLVSTTLAGQIQAKEGAGPESAGNLVGEIILHELGHAWGHSKQLGTSDHDKGGIMTATRVLDSTLRYKATKFSQASVKIILDRLGKLAERLAPAP